MAVGQRICFTCNCHRQTICAFTKTNKHLNFKKKNFTKIFSPKISSGLLGEVYTWFQPPKKTPIFPHGFPSCLDPHLQLSGRRHRSLNGFHGSGRPRISWDDGGWGRAPGGFPLEDSTIPFKDLGIYKGFVNA